MKFYLSNKFNLNSNSNVDNLYKNKNYNRTKKERERERERETNIEKRETHIDNRGFGFWVEISTNYFFILYMADKVSLFFWRKIKDATYFFQPRERYIFIWYFIYKFVEFGLVLK